MKDEKHYDGWNNGYETKKFKRELVEDVKKWKESGMTNEQIKSMTEYEKKLFGARRSYYERNYRLYDDDGDYISTDFEEYQVTIENYSDLKLFIEDERLLKAFEKYPAFRDVAIIIANGDSDIQSIAKKLNKSDNAVHIILFKVRRLSESDKTDEGNDKK